MPARIDLSKCCWRDGSSANGCNCTDDCMLCVEACPVEAITKEDVVKVNPEKCIGCGVCVAVCPKKALSLCPDPA